MANHFQFTLQYIFGTTYKNPALPMKELTGDREHWYIYIYTLGQP